MNTEMQNTNMPLELALISSFNTNNFSALLTKGEDWPKLRAVSAPYGQVMQTLLDQTGEVWGPNVRGAVIWTRPEGVSLEYQRLLRHEGTFSDALLGEVDELCALIKTIPSQVKYIFVPTWTTGAFEGRMGLLDMEAETGLSFALMRMNLRLVENLMQDPRVVVLDAARWIAVHGEKSFSPQLWYMSKTPYSVDLFKEAVVEIRAAIRALMGQAKKLVVVDLDETMWGGIVGDVGWQELLLGGHDVRGEAYRDFQLALKSLQRRGVLLGIVSKNEESTALEAIQLHPEMILKLNDFAGWRINWRDKAENISDLVAELNLGLQSVVFIDDNPVERDRVRKALPEVLVPDWPTSPLDYTAALQRLRCFDRPPMSVEDRQRSSLYATERKRKELLSSTGSIDAWLQSLEIRVAVEPVNSANLERVTQLFNKTNQMNLSTRRLTKGEIWDWAKERQHTLLAVRVVDKYGDYGLVGIASLNHPTGQESAVTDFVLSCRVMGRKVEETMLHVLSICAQSKGAKDLLLCYHPTPKNQPCLRFLEGAGLKRRGEDHQFLLDVTQPYPKPPMISLEVTLDE